MTSFAGRLEGLDPECVTSQTGGIYAYVSQQSVICITMCLGNDRYCSRARGQPLNCVMAVCFDSGKSCVIVGSMPSPAVEGKFRESDGVFCNRYCKVRI